VAGRTIVAVLPVYGEDRTVAEVVRGLRAVGVGRVIVIDDGSADRTHVVLRGLAAGETWIEVLRHDRNRGKAEAVRTGLERAEALLRAGDLSPSDVTVLIDSDGQHRPEDFPALLARYDEGRFDLVIGARDFSVYPAYRRVGNAILTGYARLLTGFRFRDVDSGYRLLRVGAIPEILDHYRGRRYSCESEISVIAALRGLRLSNDVVIRVPIYRPRTRVSDLLNNLGQGLAAAARVRLGLRVPRARGP
jgi:glycosyltransferase involved in cell wall biosynthesis